MTLGTAMQIRGDGEEINTRSGDGRYEGYMLRIDPRGCAHFKGLFWSFAHLYLSTWRLPLSSECRSVERTRVSPTKWKVVLTGSPPSPQPIAACLPLTYPCQVVTLLALNQMNGWAMNLKGWFLKRPNMTSSHVLIPWDLPHICWKLINNCSNKHIEITSDTTQW